MIGSPLSKLAAWTVLGCLGVILQPGSAEARCDSYMKDKDGQFSSLDICTSSLQRPFYRIVQHYYNDGEALIFSFAPTSRRLLCYRYEVGQSTNQHCENYGVQFFPKRFKSGKFQTFMHDLSQVSTKKIEGIYKGEHLFVTPSNVDVIQVESCFLVVNAKDNEIHIGYDEQNIIDLSSCLVSFERFMGTSGNWKKMK